MYPMLERSVMHSSGETTNRWSLLWRQLWRQREKSVRLFWSVRTQRWHTTHLITLFLKRQALSKQFIYGTYGLSWFIHGKVGRMYIRQRNIVISERQTKRRTENCDRYFDVTGDVKYEIHHADEHKCEIHVYGSRLLANQTRESALIKG